MEVCIITVYKTVIESEGACEENQTLQDRVIASSNGKSLFYTL